LIRVLIADDHPIIREGLTRIVQESPDLKVVGEARDGHEALDLVRRVLADVILLDIGMPGPGIFELMTQIRGERPNLPVLILSVYPEEQYAIRLLRLGASGYLTKDHSPDELVSAVRRVAAGRKYISPSLAEVLATQLDVDAGAPPHEVLSDREFQVLVSLANGQTVTEIARELELSPKTVSTYRSRILKKMGLSSSADLIRYALEHNLTG